MITKFIIFCTFFFLFGPSFAAERFQALQNPSSWRTLSNRMAIVMKYLPAIDEEQKRGYFLNRDKKPVPVQLCETVGGKIKENFKKQFLLPKPDKKILLNDVRDYACVMSFSRVHAALTVLDKLITAEHTRSIWLVRLILEQAVSDKDVVSGDYVLFGFALLRGATIKIYKGEDYGEIWDEVYLMLKKGLDLKVGLTNEELIETYVALLKYTSDKKLYAEHIRYNLAFQELNAVHHKWQATDVIRALFLSEYSHTLAQSYFYCGRYREAFELYKKIFGSKDLFDNPHYKKFVNAIKLDDLVVLYSLYMVVENEEDRAAIWEMFQATTENMNPESIYEICRKFHEASSQSSSAQSVASNSKKKDKPIKQQKSNPASLREIVVKQFIKDRKQKMKELVRTVKELNMTQYEKDQETYQVDPEYLLLMKKLVSNIEAVSTDAESLNEETSDLALQTRLCHEKMKNNVEDLMKVSKQFREAVRRKSRENYRSDKPTFVVFPILNLNQKRELSLEQEQLKKKEKTRGEDILTDEPQLDKQENYKNGSLINNIISCQKDVLDIFATQDSGIYPPNAVELLNILRGSESVFELGNNLKGYNAQLKKFDATGQWSFRVNDAFRVRFYVDSSNHFTDVEIGNFH
jgi:plasmid maintenance system killer protein